MKRRSSAVEDGQKKKREVFVGPSVLLCGEPKLRRREICLRVLRGALLVRASRSVSSSGRALPTRIPADVDGPLRTRRRNLRTGDTSRREARVFDDRGQDDRTPARSRARYESFPSRRRRGRADRVGSPRIRDLPTVSSRFCSGGIRCGRAGPRHTLGSGSGRVDRAGATPTRLSAEVCRLCEESSVYGASASQDRSTLTPPRRRREYPRVLLVSDAPLRHVLRRSCPAAS